tara:strand:+ start:6434 stop:6796 length:363 start_codon:yes stop_codon:yes gene_type:complete
MAVFANLYIDQGSNFTSTVTVEDANENAVNITNYTLRGQIRKSYASSTATNFTSTITVAASGQFTIALSSIQTRDLKAGRYVYDVEVVSAAGVVTRVVEGQVTVNPRVTQSSDFDSPNSP